jgi:signal transduction histidine kinase
MMGILSHDLRTPLNAVAVAAGAMLQPGHPVEDDRGKVQVIQRATKRMTEMIGTLLDLTRVESFGRLPVSPVAADLAAPAQEVLEEARASRPDRTIELVMEGDLHGHWDPARVEQAMSNLIANALQYGDPGKPVHVSLDGTGALVVLEVENEGPSIPPERMPFLFEPFSRGHADTSPHGLGLGLFIVKQIALAHNGTVNVESNTETGTRFTLLLPRAA